MAESNRIFDVETSRPVVYLPFSSYPMFASYDVMETGRIKIIGKMAGEKSVSGKLFKTIKVKDIKFIRRARIDD